MKDLANMESQSFQMPSVPSQPAADLEAVDSTAASTENQNNSGMSGAFVDPARAESPYPLEALQNLTVEIKNREDTGKPYFVLKWQNPTSLGVFDPY